MRWWLSLAAVLALGALLRLPAVRVSILNEDEALYATTAAAMQQGELPYRAGVESKPPGIFYLYRAGFELVGRYQMKALHALTIPWVLLTGLLLALLARRAGGERAGLFAALCYLVFSTVQEPAVLATQCELLYSLPLAAAALLLLLGEGGGLGRGLAWSLLAGVLCALATLIKPTAASLFGASLLWLAWRRQPGLLLALAAGFGGTWGLAALYFSGLGIWDDLVYWAFRWTTLTYVPTGFATFSFLGRFATAYGLWGAACVALLVLAARGLRSRRGGAEGTAGLLGLWALAAFAGTMLGGRFYDHYFPALVTPLATLAGLGASTLEWSPRRWGPRLLAAGIALPALACFLFAWSYETAMKAFGDTRLPYDDVAGYVREHTRPEERVFVWGYYPLIYVAADRLAASRFVGCHYLTGYAAIGLARSLPEEAEDRLGVPQGFATLLHDLDEKRAELFVDTAPANLHHWKRYPVDRYPLLSAYLAKNYVREAVVGESVIYRRKPAS